MINFTNNKQASPRHINAINILLKRKIGNKINGLQLTELVPVKLQVRKTAKIRKRYNQVPHLIQDTTWESNKDTINITNKIQEVSPFQTGDHKAAMNRWGNRWVFKFPMDTVTFPACQDHHIHNELSPFLMISSDL